MYSVGMEGRIIVIVVLWCAKVATLTKARVHSVKVDKDFYVPLVAFGIRPCKRRAEG